MITINNKRNILLTSPKGYAARLGKAFEESLQMTDFHAISVPMIQTDIYTESDDFQHLIHHLNEFDYLAFCSRKAIETFAVGLKDSGLELPSSLQLCAIGKDNELINELLHTSPAFISVEPSPQGIVNQLERISEAIGKRIAVLAPQVIGMAEPSIVPDFISRLENIGMHPVRITTYQTKPAAIETLKATSKKILDQKFEAVIFTSGTEIKVFLQMVPEGMSVDTFVKDITIICYGPYTASCANQYGLKVDFTSKAFGSFQELIKQLALYYNKV